MKYIKTTTLVLGFTVLSFSSAVNAATYFCPGNETTINWTLNSQHGAIYNWDGNFTDTSWSGNDGHPGQMSVATNSANAPTIHTILADVDTHPHSSTLACHYRINGIAPNALSPYVTQEVSSTNCGVDPSNMAITCP